MRDSSLQNATTGKTMRMERRKHPRFEASVPIRFNLDPDHHYVPAARKLGVGGTARNISVEGLMIDARMDLLDVCQIFPEVLEDDSVFGLELFFMDSRGRKTVIRGEVIWYQLSEPAGDIRNFKAGLHLKDAESQAGFRSMRLR
jgi:hypothetical protein